MKGEITERIILGIDPGTSITGYGVLRITGNKPEPLSMGILDLRKTGDHFIKIKTIFEKVVELIEEFHPDELAIEAPFYGKNVQSMLKLGRAQGAAIAAALSRSVPVSEYAPRSVKQSITGMGAASKEQVAGMLMNILNYKKDIPLDATDAMAVALCHYYQSSKPQGKDGPKNWNDFMRKNPDRVKG